MNRVYKVIWNKVKGQYVVVSELAHRCTKSAGHTAGRRAAAILAAGCLCFGWGSAWASDIKVPSVPFHVTAEEGKNGEDAQLIFTDYNDKIPKNVSVGSTVRVNTDETDYEGDLNKLTVNGYTYNLRSYEEGQGIAISDEGIANDGTHQYKVSVDKSDGLTFNEKGQLKVNAGDGLTFTDENLSEGETQKLVVQAADDNITVSNKGVGLNQKEVNIGGINIVGNRDEHDENHDNNTIQGLSNTTWDKTTMNSVSASLEAGGIEASKAATQGQLLGAVTMAANADRYLHNGTEKIGIDKQGYKVNDEGTVTMTVASDDNQYTGSVVIGNIASKKALDSLNEFAVQYDPGDDGPNYDRVTLGSHDNKYNTENHTGGTTITNVAYSDGTGSDAVNVDYLEDYVTKNGGGAWNLTTNGDTAKAVSIGNGATVDFSGVTKTIGEGEDETTQSNIVVNKTTENGTTKVAFDLAKDLNVTTITATNQYVTSVNEEDDNSVTNIAYVTGHERHIATSGDVNPDDGKQFSGEYYVNRADGTISLIEVDGNGNPTSNTLVLKDIASATDLKNLDAGVVKYDTVNGTIDYSTVTLKGDGDKGTTITNLANGEVSVTSTDAVNGSQLFEVQELAGKHTTMTVNGDVSAPAIPEGDTEGAYTDGNLQLKQKVGDKGQIEYDAKLNDDIVLGGTDGSASRVQIGGTNGTIMVTKNADNMDATTTIDGGNIYAGSSVTVGDTVKLTDKDITGLSNTTWNGTTDDASRAATEGQLQTVSDKVNGGWTATDDAGNKINVNPTNWLWAHTIVPMKTSCSV